MFVDNIRIFAKAGKGGNGLASFRREKFVPRGGPDGGDGGDGGSVILEVSTSTNDLRSYFYDPKLVATDGMPGMHARKHGRDGKTVIGKVPPGTIVNARAMALSSSRLLTSPNPANASSSAKVARVVAATGISAPPQTKPPSSLNTAPRPNLVSSSLSCAASQMLVS